MFNNCKPIALILLAATVLVLPMATVSAESTGRLRSVKNIVLVHGAFADGSSWAKVIPLLQAKGYNVVAVQNPLSSLIIDAANKASR